MKETPLMKQYHHIKAKYPDAILLFRIGDFYETFGEDAIKSSKLLGITLTKRANGSSSHIELAGFPYHSLDNYLPKLVKHGCRIAICDQLENPKTAKGIVKRGVTELITPGVTFNDQTINGKSNNFILSVHVGKFFFGISILDISTGEFFITQGNQSFLSNIISTYKPSEILIQRNHQNLLKLKFNNYIITPMEEWTYQYDFAYEKLCSHFQVNSLKGFGVENLSEGICAAGSVFTYLVEDTHHHLLAHISSIQKIDDKHVVWMDSFTQRNLELTCSMHQEGKTLFDLIDGTQTSMGGRLLKRWIILPSKNAAIIKQRWKIVSFLLHNDLIRNSILQELKHISDLERLLGKVATEKINPREMSMIRNSLESIKKIEQIIQNERSFSTLVGTFQNHSDLIEKLNKELQEEPPVLLNKGDVIKQGFDFELDHLRNLLANNKNFVRNLSNQLAKETGIFSLKIDCNSVFGYYIEVRNAHKNKIPNSWIRKQTLVNAERYITEELKEYENQIFGAEDKILHLEFLLYKKIIRSVLEKIASIQDNTRLIARLDVLLNFAIKSKENQYAQPQISDKKIIKIQDGRHPIIERSLPIGESYISNSIEINQQSQQILMITGPNMVGKSALLRQTALIIIMAQIGCYVPAKHLEFGIIDKIFTRVGASDNISQGESTFMMEMNETSSIMNNLKGNSLILLDEIGRGTSTYDGVSIAWSIIEYLHEHPSRPLTLFATHYHELNKMSSVMKRIKNFNVSITEISGKIIFLRKVLEGSSQHSFGIHVLKLAGMPNKIIKRAEEIFSTLESKTTASSILKLKSKNSSFQIDDSILYQIREELLQLEINTLTPLEALLKLHYIQQKILDSPHPNHL